VRVYLHIGLPKTGSTALQWTFDVNRELLKQNGIFYPNASPPPHEGIAHQGLVRGLDEPDAGAREWEPTLWELDHADQDVAVISSEQFSVLRDDQIAVVRSYLADHDVTVVVYLRRQDEFLHGLYCTPVLFYGETREFEQWRRESDVDTLLDYFALLARWERVFGREAMMVRPYERSQLTGGGIVSDFATCTGINLPSNLRQLTRLTTNRSYPRSAINLIRSLQQEQELVRCVPEARQLMEIIYQDQPGEADVLSPEDRQSILSEYVESNREVARRYLCRADGQLFLDESVPSQEQWDQRYGSRFADLTAIIRDAHVRFTEVAEVESLPAGSSGQQLPYSREVSPSDHMWNTGSEHYFAVGLSALVCIESVLLARGLDPQTILDMACGHGRVCRMLRARFPHAHITACDIDRDAVDFCAEHFDAQPVYSKKRLVDVQMDRRFDLVWCGSFFTHVSQNDWYAHLQVLTDWLKPGGILIFTTHGRRVVDWICNREQTYGLNETDLERVVGEYERQGFGFLTSENQPMGFSISSIRFVCESIEELPWLRLIGYHEAGWAGHQDAVSVIKTADRPVDHMRDSESLRTTERKSLART
jgi:2-polyprenyl-3-methyl-5-hydroxy-6-metoxy-1,4-benzoquinol methylase